MTGKTIASTSAAITLTSGLYPSYVPLSITSVGKVTSSTGDAIYSSVFEPWVIINAGAIVSTKSVTGIGGVVLKAGGTVTNLAGGIISGGSLGVYIAGSHGGSITNAGTINATAASGVGVKITAANATLENAGTIAAASASKTAISLSGTSDVLILDPGYALVGKAVAASTDILRLASGAMAGTLSGDGSYITGFGTTSIDAGAVWTIYGTIGSTFINNGTLTNTSTLYVKSAKVTNIGLITGDRLFLMSGDTLTNTGTISSTDTSSIGTAIKINHGVVVNNDIGGLINGPEGVYANGASVTVNNAGTILGSATAVVSAVFLRDGGVVSNAAGGLIYGYGGISFQGTPTATVVNQGTIEGVGQLGAVYLYAASSRLTNAASGTISGSTGVQLGLQALNVNVTNSGSIIGSEIGVDLYGSDTLLNTTSGPAAGYISGGEGVETGGDTDDTITNLGTIIGTNVMSGGVIFFNTGGTLVNGGSGVTGAYISGVGYGVEAYHAVTITNFGTIIGGMGVGLWDRGTAESSTLTNAGTIASVYGTYGVAVRFDDADDRLIVAPGGTFIGTVDGGGGSNTLELLAGTGTLAGVGTEIVDFQTVVVDAAAQWTLTGTPTLATGTVIDFTTNTGLIQFTPGYIDATFDGFQTGDTIGMAGITNATGINLVNGNTLELSLATGGPIDVTLDPMQTLTGATFHYATQDGNTLITADDLACFAEDTRIETSHGPVAVQQLRVGDRVRVAAGTCRPIRWIGWRTLDLTRHPDPVQVAPIRVRKDAFGPGMPVRDLYLSPDHAVFVDDGLVPIRLLVNGASILRDAGRRRITYYHVELDAHDVLLAEQLPVESYLDTGNRAMFENASLPLQLHPVPGNHQACRVAGSFAPLLDDPARVEPTWQRFAERGAQLGHALPECRGSTGVPDLHLRTGAHMHRPLRLDANRHIFLLPPGARRVRLISRHAAPCDDQPWLADRRQLGVMVRRITLRHGDLIQTIPVDDPSCGSGWWQVERSLGGMWRWTDGDAELTLPDAGGAVLEVEATGMRRYPIDQSIAMLSDGFARAS